MNVRFLKNSTKFIPLLALLLATAATNSLATTDYSVRANAFSKFGAETDLPDPVVLENSAFEASNSASADDGYPTSYGVASLVTGSVRGVVDIFGNPAPEADQGQGSFRAEFRDFVTFDLPDGMPTATIKAILDLSGTINVGAGSNGTLIENWEVNAALSFGGVGEGGIVAQDGLFDYSDPMFARELSGEFEVTDGVPVSVISRLSASADAISANILLNFDLPNSNALRFEMPDGTTFSSASGALLTAVPIPAPLILLGSCLLPLFARVRKNVG